jgi:hypothetical protein
MKTAVLWIVVMCSLVVALMMEVARTSETLINFYQTTRRYNPEDSHLHTHRRENLKSYVISQRFNLKLILYYVDVIEVLKLLSQIRASVVPVASFVLLCLQLQRLGLRVVK